MYKIKKLFMEIADVIPKIITKGFAIKDYGICNSILTSWKAGENLYIDFTPYHVLIFIDDVCYETIHYLPKWEDKLLAVINEYMEHKQFCKTII